MVEKVEKEKPKPERYELVQVPTQMGLAFRDNKEETNLSQEELILQMANDVQKIKEGIVGGK